MAVCPAVHVNPINARILEWTFSERRMMLLLTSDEDIPMLGHPPCTFDIIDLTETVFTGYQIFLRKEATAASADFV